MTPAQAYAKSLRHHLTAGGVSAYDLRALGWYDWQSHDLPDSADPRIVAASALCYMLLDEHGHANLNATAVLYAVIGFIETETRQRAEPQALRALLIALRARPVDRDAVEQWFMRTFPE